jgi:hypothetical protein
MRILITREAARVLMGTAAVTDGGDGGLDGSAASKPPPPPVR